MPVNLSAPDPASLRAVAGVELGIASAGIKKPGRRDVLVITLPADSEVVGELELLDQMRRAVVEET